MLKKTLVCLDGSKLAEEILPAVTEYCQGANSEVILLQVITAHITIPPPESTHVMTFGLDSKPDQIHTADIGKTTTLEPKAGLQLREIEREQVEAKACLDRIADRLQSKGLKVKTLTLQGEPVETILNYIGSAGVSLLAMTTHGQSGPGRGLLGRVASEILKNVEIPVLLIRAKGAGTG